MPFAMAAAFFHHAVFLKVFQPFECDFGVHGRLDVFRLADILNDVQPFNVSCTLKLDQQGLKTVRIRAEAFGIEPFAVKILKIHALPQELQDAVDNTKIFHGAPHFFLFKSIYRYASGSPYTS